MKNYLIYGVAAALVFAVGVFLHSVYVFGVKHLGGEFTTILFCLATGVTVFVSLLFRDKYQISELLWQQNVDKDIIQTLREENEELKRRVKPRIEPEPITITITYDEAKGIANVDFGNLKHEPNKGTRKFVEVIE